MYITTPTPKLTLKTAGKFPRSEYLPSKEEKAVIDMVMNHWTIANTAKSKSYREFNGMSLLDRQSLDQTRFNSYQFDDTTTSEEAWKSNAVRPITRNRVISIGAHVTTKLIYPAISAQNEYDHEDQDAANVMSNLNEWANEQSKYERTFVFAAIAALVNPAVIIQTEYVDAKRTIKVPKPGKPGQWDEITIPDSEFSGFQDEVVPLDQFWHPDFYESNIQKQPYVIRRKVIAYDTAEAKYGEMDNFKYVKPGKQVMFIENYGFYEVQDDNDSIMGVEEVIYWNRRLDLKLIFCNGVMMTPYDNPNPREDKQYPFAKSGYELVDEGQFFYYKSLVAKLGPDEEVVQTLYRMVIDGTYLQLFPPTILYGDEILNSSVVIPGASTTLSKDSRLEPLQLSQNLQAGMTMLTKVEQSINESSIDPLSQGIASSKEQTAQEIQALQDNAVKLLGLFGKMLGFLVTDFGYLRVSDILQYLTLGEAVQLLNGDQQIKFRNFVIPGKASHGKGQAKRISFSNETPENPTPEQKLAYSFKLLDEAGGLDKQEIVKVNPIIFRKTKYMLKVTPELISPKSDNVTKALNLEEFDRLIALPNIDQDAVTRDLLLSSYEATKMNPDKYFKQQQPDLGALIGANGVPQQETAAMAQQAGGQGAGPAPQTNLFNNMRKQQVMSQTMRGGTSK